MEPTTQDIAPTKNNAGGKIAIVIILIAIIFGSIYFFSQRSEELKKKAELEKNTASAIELELDQTDLNIDAELENIDKTLSN